MGVVDVVAVVVVVY